MSEECVNPVEDSDSPTAYVGAHTPLWLYRLLTEQAERAKVSRSQVLCWALDEQYRERQAAVQPWAGDQEQEAKEQDL